MALHFSISSLCFSVNLNINKKMSTDARDSPEYILEEESITKDYQQFVQDLFTQDSAKNARNHGEEYHIEKGVNLAEILSRLSSSVPRSCGRHLPDTLTRVAVLSQSVQGYLKVGVGCLTLYRSPHCFFT